MLLALGVVMGPHGGPAAQAHTIAGATRTLCSWPIASIGQKLFGNAALIDTDAVYLTMSFGYFRGTSLRISGLFPHARYMGFNVYTRGGGGVVSDHLDDQDIAPDKGSVNPLRPNADRAARRRSYTIYVRQGTAPTHGRPANTLYTGTNSQVFIVYRVYDPDPSADYYGGVPKPTITILRGDPASYTASKALSACAAPRGMWWKSGTTVQTPLQWQRVGVLGSHGGNASDYYLAVRLNRADAKAYVLRFKAPTFADTNHGKPITGREETRYWSVCQYDLATEKVVACLHDYQARSQGGYVTIQLATGSSAPTAPSGSNTLSFGSQAVGMLMIRQVLPNSSFQGSFARVADGASQDAARRALGPYYPSLTVVR